jgi:hypothetical protein
MDGIALQLTFLINLVCDGCSSLKTISPRLDAAVSIKLQDEKFPESVGKSV